MIKKVLAFYTKYFAVWVIICGLGAYLFPKPWIALKPGMSVFFALTMFGIGAVLETDDFTRIAKTPWRILIGSAAQFSIMPLGAFSIARLFHLPPPIALGLILTGSAPGAMASNIMCYIAQADVAYSVSLTTVSTLLTPLLTPGLTYLLARSYFDIDFLGLMTTVISTVIVPLVLGIWVKHTFYTWIKPILEIFPAISVTFIIFICSLVIALNRTYLTMLTGLVLSAVVALNLTGMGLGYLTGAVCRFDGRQRRTLCIEIGMQNAGLGTVLALKHFDSQTAIPAAAFVFVCIITASILAEWWRRSAIIDSHTD